MIEVFRTGGVIMWPMLAVAVGIAWLVLATAARLWRRRDPEGSERSLQAVLFWGVMSVVLGAIGTVGGLVLMTQAIALAGSVEAPLVWGGVSVSLVPLITGLTLFLLSAVSWFALRQWRERTLERPEAVPGFSR